MTLVRAQQGRFILGGPSDRLRDPCNGNLQWGRKTGFKSEYSRGKWEFTVKEQGHDQCMENYKEKKSEGRGDIAKQA